MSQMPVIGITGLIGSGKSTVRKLLSKQIPVLDLDEVNARLLEPGQKGSLLLKEMDEELFDGEILNKKKMAAKMFGDPKYKKKVEAILHPLILDTMGAWIDSYRKRDNRPEAIAVEVPLLFELGLQDHFDQCWLVTADRETAISRLVEYRGFDAEDANKRWEAQMPVEQKIKLADVILDNSKDLKQLEDKISQIMNSL